ncbi:fluoride efflux transporter CrcB [Agrobacterium sp.]|jgi:CrcB protein|uniref:fluoride efflux transporter CrcB n=1 Tax=Agrobacterium sp. TaxID=361 RepID=UPI0028AE1A7E|nr:fluoride efflux transporter CrcB [Agrobacterium sp.]
MIHVLLVAIGGAVGSGARYLLNLWAVRLGGTNFPWGTFAVNIIGGFAIGLLSEMIIRKFSASTEMRLLLVTGMLGGFTTFSSFSLDAVGLFERGEIGLSAVYVLSSVVISILAVCGGLALGRALF